MLSSHFPVFLFQQERVILPTVRMITVCMAPGHRVHEKAGTEQLSGESVAVLCCSALKTTFFCTSC